MLSVIVEQTRDFKHEIVKHEIDTSYMIYIIVEQTRDFKHGV